MGSYIDVAKASGRWTVSNPGLYWWKSVGDFFMNPHIDTLMNIHAHNQSHFYSQAHTHHIFFSFSLIPATLYFIPLEKLFVLSWYHLLHSPSIKNTYKNLLSAVLIHNPSFALLLKEGSFISVITPVSKKCKNGAEQRKQRDLFFFCSKATKCKVFPSSMQTS